MRPNLSHASSRRSALVRSEVGSPGAASEGEDDPRRFFHRPCYVFNPAFPTTSNDAHCSHCRHYLTSRCPHIDEFLDDVEDMAPE
ncbi:MAG: hypothetical protein L3K04_05195 [Thermoplasmata archaeon]|nr:hypothetical protein [Thermoplasmata archaeon]